MITSLLFAWTDSSRTVFYRHIFRYANRVLRISSKTQNLIAFTVCAKITSLVVFVNRLMCIGYERHFIEISFHRSSRLKTYRVSGHVDFTLMYVKPRGTRLFVITRTGTTGAIFTSWLLIVGNGFKFIDLINHLYTKTTLKLLLSK